MKDNKVIYLNDEHQQIVEKHLNMIRKMMYYATETTRTGKFQDYLSILDSIYSYSNNFHDTVISKKNCDNGSVAEFLFLIPNMSFYTAIGFLTALKDGNNDLELREILEKIGENCEDTTGELADILIDETENEKLINDIFGKILNKN
tara:strand:+ start:324 stop:764 length:441 start_codon:yes stop_codon:yes gene_type:complete